MAKYPHSIVSLNEKRKTGPQRHDASVEAESWDIMSTKLVWIVRGVDAGENWEAGDELEDRVCLYLDVRAPPIKGVV